MTGELYEHKIELGREIVEKEPELDDDGFDINMTNARSMNFSRVAKKKKGTKKRGRLAEM